MFGNVRERHFWTKNPTRIIVSRFGDFSRNLILGTEQASFSDKNRDHISDFLSRNDADSIPKIRAQEFLLDFLSRKGASSIPRILIFCQNSRIGVKYYPVFKVENRKSSFSINMKKEN